MAQTRDLFEKKRRPGRRGVVTGSNLSGPLVLAFSLALISSHGQAAVREAAQSSHGIKAYAGVIPASIVKGHPKGHQESTMHGGPPAAEGSYHIVLALFDEVSGVRIENALVSAKVSLPGHLNEQSLPLDAMTIAGVVTYGGYVTYAAPGAYTIDLTITPAPGGVPVQMKFIDDYVRAKP
jgi:hypothetical protein